MASEHPQNDLKIANAQCTKYDDATLRLIPKPWMRTRTLRDHSVAPLRAKRETNSSSLDDNSCLRKLVASGVSVDKSSFDIGAVGEAVH